MILGPPLRAAFFEPFGNLYGSERSALDFMSALPSAEAKITVYCPADAPWLPSLRAMGIPYVASFETGLHSKGRMKRVAAFLRFAYFLLQRRIQIIHVNQFGALPYAILAGKLFRLPVVLHSRWHEDPRSLARLKGKSLLSAVVCISEYQRALISKVDTGAVPVHLILNPYQMRVRGSPAPEVPPVFLLPARLHPHKRQDLLIRAASLFVRSHGDCKIILMGSAEQAAGYGAELAELLVSLSLQQYVKISGYNPDWVSQASAASAMIIPSDEESLGRVVFEAWDGGTVPVAWAGSGGPAATIAATGAGILYQHQTPESLAEAMHQAANMTLERRQRMVESGKRWMERNCAPEVHAHRILGVWRQALAKGTSKAPPVKRL